MKRFLTSLALIALSLNLQIHGLDNFKENQEKPKLATFKYNIYSQFGEDGILEKIFNLIGTKSKRCIEFGAWDGFHLSNTANLFTNYKWEAILIECSSTKFNQLVDNVKKYRCTCICE